MTEESYQRARKLMQQLNHLRSLIIKQKGEVARWTAMESSNKEFGKSTDGVQKRIIKELEKLDKLRATWASIVFPPHDLATPKQPVNYCRICQTLIMQTEQYCITCLENQNLQKYDFKNTNDKDIY